MKELLWHAFDTKHHPVPSSLPYKGRKYVSRMSVCDGDNFYNKFQLFHADSKVQKFAKSFLPYVLST